MATLQFHYVAYTIWNHAMNALGLEYGSSSDEEDASSSLQPQSIVTIATDVSTPEATIVNCGTKPDEVPTKPSEAIAESVESAMVTGPDVPMDDGDEEAMLLRVGIPPAVAPLAGDNETQQRIERFLRVQSERGQDFQTTLQDKKEVRNPYILEKVVEYFGIDELQSNFSPDVFDPHGLSLHEYADALALEQKKRADARTQRQLQQQRGGGPRQVQFVSANNAG